MYQEDPNNLHAELAQAIEEKVLKMRKEKAYGRRKIAWFLLTEEKIKLSENTITHILRRAGMGRKKKQRKAFYPAKWVYDENMTFKLAQVDTKDIYDKGMLGTITWAHITRKHLSRYQWTFCEGRTRVRFLAFSRKLHLTNCLCFVALVMSWLRAFGIEEKVFWQKDWGQEFGGDNPGKLRKLNATYYRPYGAILGEHPREDMAIRDEWKDLTEPMIRSSIFFCFSLSKMKNSFCTMHKIGYIVAM